MSAAFAVTVFTLLLGACDLYNLDDSGSSSAQTCPTDRELVDADLPCVCWADLVDSLDRENCYCVPDEGLSCTDVIDTGIYGDVAR